MILSLWRALYLHVPIVSDWQQELGIHSISTERSMAHGHEQTARSLQVVINPWQDSELPLQTLTGVTQLSEAPLQPPSHGKHGAGAIVRKLNTQQVAAVLQSFWPELLQNNVKAVKKILTENHLKMDFNAARYRPHADGTALHICAQHGLLVAVKLLLDFGLDINAQNKVGLTPLHIACKFQQIPTTTLLLDHGARLDVPDNVRLLLEDGSLGNAWLAVTD